MTELEITLVRKLSTASYKLEDLEKEIENQRSYIRTLHSKIDELNRLNRKQADEIVKLEGDYVVEE